LLEECWVLQAERCRAAVEAALPDTCAEVYFNLGPLGRHAFNACTLQPLKPLSAWVVGPRATPLLVAKETRDSDIVGIRLRTGMASQLLGVPMHELQGKLVELECLWGAAVERIRERLAACSDGARRMRIVERAVLARAPLGGRLEEAARVRALCVAVGSARYRSVGELARAHGLSHRNVIALFDRHVGLKPKQYDRVQRLRRVLRAVHAQPRPAWAQLAVRCGYFDQAHLIHDFRGLTGMSPREYDAKHMAVGLGFVPHTLALPT
jgi:AraC-like DNA-binding protein